MHVILYCPGMPFHGGTVAEGGSLGGSESAAYYLARELAALGAQVTVFTGIAAEEAGAWAGVRYLPAGPPTEQAPLGRDFEWYAAVTPHDVLIVQRAPYGFHRPYAGRVNLWWSHDLALRRHQPAMARQLWNVDRVLAVSDFHREQVARVYGLPAERIAVIRNGIDPALFAGAGDDPEAAARKWAGGRMVYSSRPERGLGFLVEPGGVMERLAETHPGLSLVVAGYDNTAAPLQGYYEHLWARCDALPNVERLGSLSKKELADVMGSAWLHAYPTAFEEVSCITAMEAQAAGNPVLTCPVGALPETLTGGGAQWVQADPDELPARFAEAAGRLRDDRPAWERLHRQALAAAAGYGWRAPAEAVLALAERVLREKSAAPRRLARHLLRHSDVMAARSLARRCRAAGEPLDAAVERELDEPYRFVDAGAWREHYEAFARWQAARGVDHGLADPERVRALPRLRVVEEVVAALPAGARVLDFGCGPGHFTLALARAYPGLRFTGVDLAESHVAAGRAAIEREGLDNVGLDVGGVEAVEGEYDCILACEVLEHLPGPGATVDALERHLRPGGVLCLTVPYGPWEAESWDEVPFRGHLHHLERADLEALWGHKPGYRVLAVPVRHSERDEPLGVYRVTWQNPTPGPSPRAGRGADPTPGPSPDREERAGDVTPGASRSGRIDVERKLRRQAPRETVSACLVCRDDGRTLARTLESVRGFADQIVIGLDGDPAAEGPAWDIARRYGAEAFAVDSPLRTGFDVARNRTLERAWGDWVLWIDDDEVFEWPERLHKYLRPNGYDAYAVKQHHYAVEPEGVIKTDYPCRLFRNRPGVRFYGVVHEHPERSLNRGFDHVLLLPDMAICHAGYDTEAVRRRRFRRNLPLMVRDRQQYPQRWLGKFLWIRDLVHLNRYALEAGGALTPRLQEQAAEAVALWRELLDAGQLRMAVDALPYYSEAVQALAGEGIAYELAMGAAAGGVGDLDGGGPPVLRGRFLDTRDIRALTEALLRDKTAVFDERYF